jgi:hypothetical protein
MGIGCIISVFIKTLYCPLSEACHFGVQTCISLQGNQQNAPSCSINVSVTLHHRKFLHVSICKMIIIREHRLNNIA